MKRIIVWFKKTITYVREGKLRTIWWHNLKRKFSRRKKDKTQMEIRSTRRHHRRKRNITDGDVFKGHFRETS